MESLKKHAQGVGWKDGSKEVGEGIVSGYKAV